MKTQKGKSRSKNKPTFPHLVSLRLEEKKTGYSYRALLLLITKYMHKAFFFPSVTERVMDLDLQSKMIIFESLLTTFEDSIIF